MLMTAELAQCSDEKGETCEQTQIARGLVNFGTSSRIRRNLCTSRIFHAPTIRGGRQALLSHQGSSATILKGPEEFT